MERRGEEVNREIAGGASHGERLRMNCGASGAAGRRNETTWKINRTYTAGRPGPGNGNGSAHWIVIKRKAERQSGRTRAGVRCAVAWQRAGC